MLAAAGRGDLQRAGPFGSVVACSPTPRGRRSSTKQSSGLGSHLRPGRAGARIPPRRHRGGTDQRRLGAALRRPDLLDLLPDRPRVRAAATGQPPLPAPASRRMLRDAKSGLRTIVRTRARFAQSCSCCGRRPRCLSPPTPWPCPMQPMHGAPPWAATALLAATPAGAAVGALLVARLPIGRQLRLVFPLAIASTAPDAGDGRRATRSRRRLCCGSSFGLCQGYVVTLMALSVQLTPEHRRGRVFGVAGAGFNGMAIVGLRRPRRSGRRAPSPAAAVVLAGALGLLIVVLAALLWPQRDVRSAVRASYGAARAGASEGGDHEGVGQARGRSGSGPARRPRARRPRVARS